MILKLWVVQLAYCGFFFFVTLDTSILQVAQWQFAFDTPQHQKIYILIHPKTDRKWGEGAHQEVGVWEKLNAKVLDHLRMAHLHDDLAVPVGAHWLDQCVTIAMPGMIHIVCFKSMFALLLIPVRICVAIPGFKSGKVFKY